MRAVFLLLPLVLVGCKLDRMSMIIECSRGIHRLALENGARDRNRTDTPPFGIAADFKNNLPAVKLAQVRVLLGQI